MLDVVKVLDMKEFIEILKNNWEIIVAVFLFVLSFILQLVKKKPINIMPSIKEMILAMVPEAISNYEKFFGAGNGEKKKEAALNFIMAAIIRIYPLDQAQYDAYRSLASQFIENVLSAPQKKEVK